MAEQRRTTVDAQASHNWGSVARFKDMKTAGECFVFGGGGVGLIARRAGPVEDFFAVDLTATKAIATQISDGIAYIVSALIVPRMSPPAFRPGTEFKPDIHGGALLLHVTGTFLSFRDFDKTCKLVDVDSGIVQASLGDEDFLWTQEWFVMVKRPQDWREYKCLLTRPAESTGKEV